MARKLFAEWLGTFFLVAVVIGSGIMAELEDSGKLKTVMFTERQKLIDAATPVLQEYFNDLGATDLYNAIQAVK